MLVAKYAEHCPLHRRAQICARSGLDLDRSMLAGWVGKASFHLKPAADRLARRAKARPTVNVMPFLPAFDEPGTSNTRERCTR